MDMPVQIKQIGDDAGLTASLAVIRESFQTVALQFGLTWKNCPTHASFITMEKLVDLSRKAQLYGLFEDDTQVGFIAIEKGSDGRYFLDRLAVSPRFRRIGHGRRLVEFVLKQVKSAGGSRVSLGMIDGHIELKRWYEKLGFVETGKRTFHHLPFTVCFMDYIFQGNR
jgi:ribosomal protein S18 acetylase RimI-like enzyme